MYHIFRVVPTLFVCSVVASTADLPVTEDVSIQEMLDANPGRLIFVPAGEYRITEKIRIRAEGAGLFGSGRIIQQNPE